MRSSRILQRSDPSAAQNDARFFAAAVAVRRFAGVARVATEDLRGEVLAAAHEVDDQQPWHGDWPQKKTWSNWWSKQPNMEVEWKLKQIWRLSENWEHPNMGCGKPNKKPSPKSPYMGAINHPKW